MWLTSLCASVHFFALLFQAMSCYLLRPKHHCSKHFPGLSPVVLFEAWQVPWILRSRRKFCLVISDNTSYAGFSTFSFVRSIWSIQYLVFSMPHVLLWKCLINHHLDFIYFSKKYFFVRIFIFIIIKYSDNKNYFIYLMINVKNIIEKTLFFWEKKMFSSTIIVSCIFFNYKYINNIKVLYLYINK